MPAIPTCRVPQSRNLILIFQLPESGTMLRANPFLVLQNQPLGACQAALTQTIVRCKLDPGLQPPHFEAGVDPFVCSTNLDGRELHHPLGR